MAGSESLNVIWSFFNTIVPLSILIYIFAHFIMSFLNRVYGKLTVPSAERNIGAGKQGSAVISAKPQLRNTQAELTRLVPVALRVKREQPKTNKQKVKSAIAEEGFRPSPAAMRTGEVIAAPTKDDAYAQFMKEMEILL